MGIYDVEWIAKLADSNNWEPNMKGFKVLIRKRGEDGAVKGLVKQSSALYRFEVLRDDTVTLWRMSNGEVSREPARAPKTEAMLRRALTETTADLEVESLQPKLGPR